MKNQKGITLVALIITIIVMVILAGVIIAAAVADGGVIDRAQGAMREHERGEIEDLIISSYVYKTTASTNTLAVLDLEKTSEAIYENLTDNGFKIKDSSGNEFNSKEEFVAVQEDNKININVEGNHGEYSGEITEDGLDGKLEIKDENNSITDTEAEEAVWGEVKFENGDVTLYYIGDETNLIVTSDIINVQEVSYNYDMSTNKETWEIIEGSTKKAKFSDYTTIEMRGCEVGGKKLEKVDFGNKLSAKNTLSFYDNNTIEEVKGLEGLVQIDGFGYTNSLNVVILPSTANEIKDWGFERNTAINTITVPGNIKKIGNESFRNCSNLINITIEEGVEYIGESAFYDTKLEQVTIPSTIKYIGNNAFSGYLPTLKQVTINKTKAEVEAEGGIGTAWIPDSVTRIIYLDQTVDLKYEFTFGDILKMKDTETSDMWWIISPENFWADNVSEELKNSTIKKKPAAYEQEFITYNITCENENYINIFDADKADGVANAYGIMVQDGNIMFGLTAPDGNQIESENYSEYEDLKFTISMSE